MEARTKSVVIAAGAAVVLAGAAGLAVVLHRDAQPPFPPAPSKTVDPPRAPAPAPAPAAPAAAAQGDTANAGEPSVQPLDEAGLHQLFDALEARARAKGHVSALEIEPGFTAIEASQNRLGPEKTREMWKEFNTRMQKLSAELQPH